MPRLSVLLILAVLLARPAAGWAEDDLLAQLTAMEDTLRVRISRIATLLEEEAAVSKPQETADRILEVLLESEQWRSFAGAYPDLALAEAALLNADQTLDASEDSVLTALDAGEQEIAWKHFERLFAPACIEFFIRIDGARAACRQASPSELKP